MADNTNNNENPSSSIFGSFSFDAQKPMSDDQTAASAAQPAPANLNPGNALSEQQQQYLQQQQMQFKQQQQAQFIQYQQMMAQMPPQQQQIYQAQMMAVQQQQNQYQAALLQKQQQQFLQQQKQKEKQGGDSKPEAENASTIGADQPQAAGGHMQQAFQYQQQQAKYNNQISQLNMQNQFNQMNPMLYQQQMIHNMQYRQPNYQHRGNQQQFRNNRDEKDREPEKEQPAPVDPNKLMQNEAQITAQLEFIKKLEAERFGLQDKPIAQDVADKHAKLQILVQNLVDKIQKKHESLMLSTQQLQVYQETLKQKYNPIFDHMDDILKQKKLEYLSHLTEHLEQNNDRIQLEKESLQKLEASWKSLTPEFKMALNRNNQNAKILIERQQKIEEAERKAQADKEAAKAAAAEEGKEYKEEAEEKPDDKEEEEGQDKEKKDEPELKVNGDQIKAISVITDEFANIITKNFSVYAQYDDFTFGKSRSTQKVDEKLQSFFKEHFSGDYQLKNSFEPNVLPRIFYLEQKTKFIYSYKIMNYMTQAIMISNKFNIPDMVRYVITPKGNIYVIGGFNPQTKEFLNDAYELDEYRSILKPLNNMFYPRADHVVHKFKDNIYVLGGMAYREDKVGGRPFVQSLNTCEFFSISSKKWIMLPNFEKPRQAFSVCQFNEKFIFIIGGKCLKPEARVGDKYQFDYVQEVEAFDIEKNLWKTINFITDNVKLRIIHGGATQVTGQKIMIFGGMIETEDEEEDPKQVMNDNGQIVKLTDQTYFLDVTNGAIKRGPNLQQPSYYINNGGNLLSIQNRLYAQGFGINHEYTNKTSLNAIAAKEVEKESESNIVDANNTYSHKKILHCYNLADGEFSEIHEGIFSSGTRRQSFDLDD